MGTPIRRGGRLSAPGRERATSFTMYKNTRTAQTCTHRGSQSAVRHSSARAWSSLGCGGAPPAVASRVDLPGSPLSAPPHSGLRRARGGPHLAPAWVRPRRPRPARRPRGSRMPHRAAGRPARPSLAGKTKRALTLAGKRGRSSCFIYLFAHHRATTSHGQEASCGGVTWKSKGRPGAARGTTLKPTELSICIGHARPARSPGLQSKPTRPSHNTTTFPLNESAQSASA